MKKFTAAVILGLITTGVTALIYIETAPSPSERAARMRGCTLCHSGDFAETPLSTLSHWQHGTPLTPLVKQTLLAAHPTLPGGDTDILTDHISAQQLKLLLNSREHERGAALYTAKCATCHGKNGEGEPGNYPPLQGSEWLTPSPNRPTLESIIRDGLQGPITVKGQPWDSTMLPPGIAAPDDIRAIIEYLQRFR